MTDGYRRLHPATVVIELARQIGRLIYIILFVLIASLLGGRGDTTEIWLGVLGLIGVVFAVVRYLSFRFRVGDGVLEIRTGILARQLRTIPLASIQNINVRETLIHRPFGTVDLEIETGSGLGGEAKLSALGRADAELLRRVLRGGQVAFELPVEVADGTIWRATSKDLLLLGMTDNRAGAIVGAYFGLSVAGGEQVVTLRRILESAGAVVAGGGQAAPWVNLVAGGVMLVLVGWLLAIVTAFVRYHGFVLLSEPRGLVRRFGLTTRVENVIVLARLQTIAFRANWIRRKLGLWEAEASTTGAFTHGAEQAATSTVLCPLIRAEDRWPLAKRVFAGLDAARLNWRGVHPFAVRRGFFGALYLLGALVALAAFFLDRSWWWGLFGVVPVAMWYGSRRWRVMRFAWQDGFLVVRSGVLTRRYWVVPEGKVQHVAVVQSPFQRRAGVMDLHVASASVGTLAHATIYDLPVEEALALQDELSRRAEASGAWMPDAV
jgi:putative membrane protein